MNIFGKNLALWIIIGLLLVALFNLFSNSQSRGPHAQLAFSDFLGEVAGLSANPTFRQAQGEDIMDAQIGYEFRGGFLKGLTVLAQAKNLLDTPFITYQNNDRRQVIDYQRYGRDFYLGLTYRF